MAKESSSGESFLRAVRPGVFLAGAHKISRAGGEQVARHRREASRKLRHGNPLPRRSRIRFWSWADIICSSASPLTAQIKTELTLHWPHSAPASPPCGHGRSLDNSPPEFTQNLSPLPGDPNPVFAPRRVLGADGDPPCLHQLFQQFAEMALTQAQLRSNFHLESSAAPLTHLQKGKDRQGILANQLLRYDAVPSLPQVAKPAAYCLARRVHRGQFNSTTHSSSMIGAAQSFHL
jgi:hypothetical protein